MAAGWVALALLLAPSSLARADVRPLSLYQKTARAALVARVRATSDSTRRPVLDVVRVFKGSYTRPQLAIVPFRRREVGDRTWLRPEVFRAGREYLLFLNPYDAYEDDDDFFVEEGQEEIPVEGHFLFVVLNAHRGVMEIPAEGAEALDHAVERFSRIITLLDYDLQSRELRSLLSSSNPFMVEAALQQVADHFLARDEDSQSLLKLLESPRVPLRAGAVRVLGQLASEARVAGRTMESRELIRDHLVSRAFNDKSAQVRSQAVWALGRLGGAGSREVLKRISREDPDQEVRYRAEIALAEISGSLGPPRGSGP